MASAEPQLLSPLDRPTSWDGIGFGTMAGWTEPGHSRSAVDRAGSTYVAPDTSAEDRELALAVINNWRSSHSFPLNTLQNNLRGVAVQHDQDPTVA